MNKIVVQLPVNRDYAGRLEIQNDAGKRIAGPFRICGRADNETARTNKNPERNPLLPFGDTPFGEYQIIQILPSGPGTQYSTEEFGPSGIVLMRPKLGDAALADANGRFGFFIQGGARTRSGLLRPTLDGSLRLSDYDQRRFISAMQKAGGTGSFCLVVSTAKLGAKVAVAKESGKSRRNTPASILLASSVIASSVTGVVRQVWVRAMMHGVGTAVTAGVAFVAEHASAQSGGEYNPTAQAAAVDDHSQDATHASSDEAAHQQAGQGIDTSASSPSVVDLSGKQGIVSPDAASGGLPPASQAGMAPGSPINDETPPANQPENQNNGGPATTPVESQPPADNSQTTEAPATTAEPDSQTGDGNSQPHLNSSLPGTYLNDTTGNGNNNPGGIPGLPGIYVNGQRSESDATGPSDTQLRPLNQIENGVRAGGDQNAQPADAQPAGNETPDNQNQSPATGQDMNQSPSAQEPAAQAAVQQENQNLANPTPQSTETPQPGVVPDTQPMVAPGDDLKDAVASPPNLNVAPSTSTTTVPAVMNSTAMGQLGGLAAQGATAGTQPIIDTAGTQQGAVTGNGIATPPSAPVISTTTAPGVQAAPNQQVIDSTAKYNAYNATTSQQLWNAYLKKNGLAPQPAPGVAPAPQVPPPTTAPAPAPTAQAPAAAPTQTQPNTTTTPPPP